MKDRIVAGAPVKHAPALRYRVQIDTGTWRETYADGSEVIVCDLTSPLWTWRPSVPKPREKSRRR